MGEGGTQVHNTTTCILRLNLLIFINFFDLVLNVGGGTPQKFSFLYEILRKNDCSEKK